MIRILKIFISTEQIASIYQKNISKAVLAANQKKSGALFSRSFIFLLEEREAQLLSDLILYYGSEIENFAPLKKSISAAQFSNTINLLVENKLDPAALMLCDRLKYEMEALEILAKRGQANELMMRVAKNDTVDKELLEGALKIWEKYNWDIRNNQTIVNALNNIAKYAPKSIPDYPRVKESIDQFEEAANLYVKEGDLFSAANCYEKAEMYSDAFRIFKEIGDNERASCCAEKLGNLEKAFELVVNPERRMRLLLRMERFHEAREFAAGFETPDKYFDQIKEQARKRMKIKAKAHDFIGALRLADIAECHSSEREKYLSLGRQHFDSELASAVTKEDVDAVYQDRIKLEEMAGNFEEAGRLAEEILEDLNLASRLYEKANLFNRAIGTASGHTERLAELHEKGGNLLKAAELFEDLGQYDKAFEMYEDIQYFYKAIECYLKTKDPNEDVLIRLYSEAGEYEKVVELYMRPGTLESLEEGLAIATTHRLSSHIKVLEEKISELTQGSYDDLKRCFEEAKAEVLDTYSQTIGIDFGTTNSVIAIYNRKTEKVEIIPAPNGSEYIPSFWGIDDNHQHVFGETARVLSLSSSNCVVARFKRSLGKTKSFSVDGENFRSEQVVAIFLQHLKSNAENYVQSKIATKLMALLKERNLRFSTSVLDDFLFERTGSSYINSVVLSVPAYFNDNQKRATRDAAEIAGLRVRRLLHEPSAAALAYGYQNTYAGKLAVIDLGGGTLDISIVDIGEGVNDVQTIGGDIELGGSDIDAILVEHIIKDIKQFQDIYINEEMHSTEIARLRDACEKLKINLSTVLQSTIKLHHFLNEPEYNFALTRKELEHLSQPVLSRIRSTVSETIKDYASTIDSYILVGNATKMPAIRDLVKNIIPAKQLAGLDPGTVVATGAALQGSILAGELKQILLLDIVPYSLGIAAIKEGDDHETISKLIEKDATIPISTTENYSTKEDNQSSVHIKIYQGESSQLQKNHFLGDFVLYGIQPASAGKPRIEVTFDIGADCILTVSAQDRATGNQQSMRIEGAVVLSPQEKENLRNYFMQREKTYSVEKELEKTRLEIETSISSCDEILRATDHAIKDFSKHFSEKVEINPQLYKANTEQVKEIQTMFIYKDQLAPAFLQFQDQFSSTLNNLKQIESIHLDFSKSDIATQIENRMHGLKLYEHSLENIITSVQGDILEILENWISILKSLEPDLEQMDLNELASYHLTEGRVNEVREILESRAAGSEGLTKESFHLLLNCYVLLGLKDEYRDVHSRYGNLFGMVYPDFNRLNNYLKAVDESIFMIQGVSEKGVVYFGSGFCVAANSVVTNRHVIEKMLRQQIKIIGKNSTINVDNIMMDPIHDLAILTVNKDLCPLTLGEFSFVEPGEQVLALGFPSPNSNIHSENIYISKGIINSIRRIATSSDRVIFIDAKIGSGMSGGPLINELGDVVGIITMIQYSKKLDEEGQEFVENQPVALPIDLVKKYISQ